MIAPSRCRPPARFWRICVIPRRSSLGHIARVTPYRRADTLALDEMTRRSLELVRTLREGKREGSLLSVIDLSATPMGSRQLAEWLTSPLTSPELILERLDAVDELLKNRAFEATSAACSASPMTWSAWQRGSVPAGRHPRDLVALARTLAILPKLKARLDGPDFDPAEPARGRTRALPRGPRRDRGRTL